MTTGEKISKLRRQENLTQEQLADLLEVSRQSISKWESDIAFPETDKLIKISERFKVTVDYLLKESIEEPTATSEEKPHILSISLSRFTFEYKSKRTLWGMPLVHINWGLGRTAKGVFAIGLKAKGIISFGILSMGIISLGVLSLGIISLGVLALGLLGIGAFGFGAFAMGAISVGLFSTGALSVGYFYAYGDQAYASKIAIGATKASASVFTSASGFQNHYVYNKEEVCDVIDETIDGFTIFKNWIKAIL